MAAADHFSKDAGTPWEIEAAEREVGEQHARQSRTPKAAFLLGMLVATIGLLAVQHYGLGDASLTKFFFSPVVPQVQPVSGAIGPLTFPRGPQMNAGGDNWGGHDITRNPAPTVIDPNDPKSKQNAIHPAESFADYMARQQAAGGGAVAAPAAPAPAAPAPVAYAPTPAAAPAAAAPSGAWDGEKDIYDFEKQKEIFLRWDPNAPRTYTNFNPFERNLDGGLADYNGCFPGESHGYKSPNRPNVGWDSMQEEYKKMEELKKHPNFGLKGCPGCWSLKWQENLGPPP